MRGLSRQTDIRNAGVRIAACAAVLAAAGAGGLAAGFTVKHFGGGHSGVVVADIPPSDTVDLRFPADWTEPEGGAPPRTLAFASADGTFTLFNPQPIMPIPETPIRAEASEPHAQARPAVATAAVAPTRMALASADSKPVVLPAATAQPVTPPPAAARPAPVHRSSAVLNDSQIASIKRRLNLSPDQERYWPAVAAELRKMEYKKDKSAQGARMAAVDMSKVNVDGLKSAGFPLVMSFNDDQRRELKSLAHLLGLESVMSGF
jgi:hypothetical protein